MWLQSLLLEYYKQKYFKVTGKLYSAVDAFFLSNSRAENTLDDSTEKIKAHISQGKCSHPASAFFMSSVD